ncbi:tRNA (guanine(26)-N(2))-dimethyltransferase [Halobacterium noricense]|uniref:tRNA (guanine(26)-N(2))-dimethyltransferase n=1 Tax=Halobacterium noricense TaxID=223182 RepID=UPI001E363FBA|nr:tRNA (guanine(26)-N(2))-dimethyltransferase [Halobacterium noricense]UHH25027.1 tRNA (guanine(26)-N(2))-dimethyltransferase [Halobacterium noricense]
MLVEEGGVTVEVPGEAGGGEGVGEGVFFNPTQELNRDLTVAALSAYREREPRAGTYLDAMAASGIRGVRAANNDWKTTLADLDPDSVELSRANLARNDLDGEVVQRNVNSLLHEDGQFFDVVDLDPFGTPIPFADAAFANARNLVCVTATDTAPLCGAHFESGVRKYSAVPRNTEYHAEMGLRVLLSALARTAARYDVGVTPIFSHVSDHYVRTYLDLSHTATEANEAIDELGYVYHCQECLHREYEYGLIADSPETCPRCGGRQVLPAGPLWLGPAHDREFVAGVREHVTDYMGTAKRARKLLDTIAGELHEPTHFDQHRLYKQWSEPAVGMDEFLDELREAGLAASRTQYGGTTFKTDGTLADVEAAVRE